MIKNFLKKYRTWKHAKSQSEKVYIEGTLLNAFYKSKTIFIHIPKTAGVSLLKAIYGDVTLEGHRSFEFNRIALGVKKKEYFSFSFVRNPFDRLYSAYIFLKDGGMNNLDKLSFESYLSSFIDFEDFVLNGLDQKIIYKITHFIPQYEFLCDKKDHILVDFLGRFETLNNDVDFLSKKLNIHIKLKNYNFSNKKNYRDVYTNDMIKIVKNIYQKDLSIFNYKFN